MEAARDPRYIRWKASEADQAVGPPNPEAPVPNTGAAPGTPNLPPLEAAPAVTHQPGPNPELRVDPEAEEDGME